MTRQWDVSRTAAADLSAEEVCACSALSFGEEGVMTSRLRVARRERYTMPVYRIVDNEELIGWAAYWFDPCLEAHDVNLFVAEDHRGEGVGHALLRAVQADTTTYYVVPHDLASLEFFLRSALPGTIATYGLNTTDEAPVAIKRAMLACITHPELFRDGAIEHLNEMLYEELQR
jgi:hypothetical protein